MKKVEFKSEYEIYESNLVFSESQIKEEPMLYGASMVFARENGGIITNSILDKIWNIVGNLVYSQGIMGYHPVIDTKVTMLMPGWYPSIPGWHCDGVKRSDMYSQPDLSCIDEKVYHFITSVCSEDTCQTQIINEDCALFVNESSVWKSVDGQIDDSLGRVSLRNGDIARFTRGTLHRCIKADKRCWRFFFRLSFYHMPAMNEIRKQVQIYTDVNQGW